MKVIDWTFDDKDGRRVATMQSADSMYDFDEAGRIAQRLANELQTTIKFTAWHEDREGGTAFRRPTRRAFK